MLYFDPDDLVYDQTQVNKLQYDMVGEMLKAVHLPDKQFPRNFVNGLTKRATTNFAEVMADFDRVIGLDGLPAACTHLLDKLVNGVSAVGTEHIPLKGPAVIAANHPGTYDAISVLSALPREDVRIIVGANPFFRDLTAGKKFLLFSTREQSDRVEVIRQGIQHLENGGLLLYFPYGHISTDPAVMEGAEEMIRGWSRSLEIFLRKVPSAKLVLAVISGVINKGYIDHPLPNMFKGFERRRIIEFLQMIRQMVHHIKQDLHIRINFQQEAQSVDGSVTRMQAIIRQELSLLSTHMNTFYPSVQNN